MATWGPFLSPSRSPEEFDQALLPSSMGPTPKEVTTEESQAHVVTVKLRATRAGVGASAQEQPRVIPLSPLYSSQTECQAVMGTGLRLGHWLQESRRVCWGPGLPLWKVSPGALSIHLPTLSLDSLPCP